MSSTEADVRNVIVAAIQAVAQSSLGFDDVNGNVKDYLIDYERSENWPRYLAANVGGSRVMRAWAVQVVADDVIFATQSLANRQNYITIRGYYDLGFEGAGQKDMIDHARAIRGVLMQLGTRLSGTVDFTREGTPLEFGFLDAVDTFDGAILTGTMTYIGEEVRPEF